MTADPTSYAAGIEAVRQKLSNYISIEPNRVLDMVADELRRLAPERGGGSGDVWRSNYQNAWSALQMIRETVEAVCPAGALPSQEAVLGTRGPEPVHEAEAICEAIATLSPAPPAAPSGWREIASAPKDGTPILVYEGDTLIDGSPHHYIDSVFWFAPDHGQEGWHNISGQGGISCDPTHWQPLPAPPGAAPPAPVPAQGEALTGYAEFTPITLGSSTTPRVESGEVDEPTFCPTCDKSVGKACNSSLCGFADSWRSRAQAAEAKCRELEGEVARLSALLKDKFEGTRLLRAGPDHGRGGFGFDLEGGPIPYIAEYLAQMLGYRDEGGKPSNYVEIDVNHHELGAMSLTLQRRAGLAPARKAAEAEARADRLTTAAQAARDALEPFALLASALDNGNFLFNGQLQDDADVIMRGGEGEPQLDMGNIRRAREALASLASVLDGGKG